MAIDIDGYAVLGAIAREPQAFQQIKNEVSKVARGLVVKEFKGKTFSIEGLKKVSGAIGQESFDLILDLMTDAEIKSLVGKADKQNARIKSDSSQSQRKHVSELASGLIAPATKKVAAKAAPKPKSEKAKVERAGNARFATARRRTS